jgi:hypothetical protein
LKLWTFCFTFLHSDFYGRTSMVYFHRPLLEVSISGVFGVFE